MASYDVDDEVCLSRIENWPDKEWALRGHRCFFSGNRFQGDLEDHVSDNLNSFFLGSKIHCNALIIMTMMMTLMTMTMTIYCRDIALTFVHSNFSLVAGEIKNIPLSLSITSL